MKAHLTDNDIMKLKYRCRVGYFLPGLLFLLMLATVLTFHYELGISDDPESLAFGNASFVVLGLFVFAAYLSFAMNRKYSKDIRNNFKIAHTKTIQRVSKKRDFEAGSGIVGKSLSGNTVTKHMKEFARYDLIIENTKYLIDEELYSIC